MYTSVISIYLFWGVAHYIDQFQEVQKNGLNQLLQLETCIILVRVKLLDSRVCKCWRFLLQLQNL